MTTWWRDFISLDWCWSAIIQYRCHLTGVQWRRRSVAQGWGEPVRLLSKSATVIDWLIDWLIDWFCRRCRRSWSASLSRRATCAPPGENSANLAQKPQRNVGGKNPSRRHRYCCIWHSPPGRTTSGNSDSVSPNCSTAFTSTGSEHVILRTGVLFTGTQGRF